MPLDFASILSAKLAPDYEDQMLARQQASAQTQQADTQRQAMQFKLAEAQREQQEKASAQADLHEVLLRPSPAKITAFHFKHPAYAAEAKAGFDMLDADHKTSELTQMGSIFYRAQAGDHAGAAKLLRTRIDADKAAGQDTEEDEALLAGLESDDPRERNLATGHIGIVTAAADPDKFAKMFPASKVEPTDLEKKYREIQARRGTEYADQWYSEQTQDVVVGQPGAPVYRKSDIIGGSGFKQGGGDPASTAAAVVPATTATPTGSYAMPVHGGTFTSGIGDARPGGRKHNGQDIAAPLGTPVSPIATGTVVAVGRDKLSGNFVKIKHADGTTSSYSHLGTQAVKVGDPVAPGQSLGTVGATGNATGNVLHLRVMDKSGRNVDPRALLGGLRVKVRSIQEAKRLPHGTKILLPDGREGTVP